MILEVNGKGKVLVYLGMSLDDWKNLVGTINNQDFPLLADEDFSEIVTIMRERIPEMEPRVLDIGKWAKLSMREKKFVLVRIDGEVGSVMTCKKCGNILISEKEIEVPRCLAWGGAMNEWERK